MLDVLVIGAGPTGMLLAAEAARFGLSCRIIDKGTSSYEDRSRAVGIQPRTMEILDLLGLIDAFLAEGMRVRAANPIGGSKRLGRITFDSLQSPYPFILSIEQAKTERILKRYLESFGIKIEKGIECLDLKQTENGVETFVGQQRIESRWVVGCDGAHSTVRKLLDLPFEGHAVEDFFSLADVYMQWQYPHDEVYAFLNPKGILAAIPLPEANRYRLVFQLHNVQSRSEKPTIEEVQNLLHEYAGPQAKIMGDVWMANFVINSRMTRNYRKGRVFLAGDAAHIHSPVGAQGLNTGLQDAFNLAWKLKYPQLLDTYHLERHRVGKRLLLATEKATYLATMRNPTLVWLRNQLLSWLIKIPKLRSSLIRAISQTAICYPQSAIVKGKKAGLRAPNAPVQSTDLYTLWRKSTKFQLLLFSGPERADHSEIAKHFTTDLIQPLLIDDSEAHRIYEVKKACAYLIRPDNYICAYTENVTIDDISSNIPVRNVSS